VCYRKEEHKAMILITGGLGFLGANLARHLLEGGRQVLLTHHRNAKIPELVEPFLGRGLAVAPMDISDVTSIGDAIKRHRVRSIVHAAAIDEGTSSLYQAVGVNVMGIANVLEAARLLDVGRVTFVSSEDVNQGHKGRKPIPEEEHVWVRSGHLLPATKKMAEALCFLYRQHYQMDIVVTRPSHVYGPLHTAGRDPILRMVVALVTGGAAVFDDIDAEEGHDFVYVRDCARALAMVHCAEQLRHDLYNIGRGRRHTFGEVAKVLEQQSGRKFELATGIRRITSTEFDSEACLDISRLRDEFDYMPEYDLERGIDALTAWVRDGSYL
jgi:UDP-glucose 4-epimerase